MSDPRFTEIVSSTCEQCKYNMTGLRAMNPVCVHCTRVKFSRSDMFEKKDEEE